MEQQENPIDETFQYTVVIPARYASQRLPGKPLVDIAGKTMIERVYEQAKKSRAHRIVIATDNEDVYQTATGFGAEVVMTQSSHPSGTDRLQEVAQQLAFSDRQIVVNVQGDEPLIPPKLIDQVAMNLSQTPKASIATLCTEIGDREECLNPNAVKVVRDRDGFALYFSRAPIPFDRSEQWGAQALGYRHLGLYAYRVAFLHQYVSWSPAPIETLECLEQLRALYNGVKIHVAVAEQQPPVGVDTSADLEQVRRIFLDT